MSLKITSSIDQEVSEASHMKRIGAGFIDAILVISGCTAITINKWPAWFYDLQNNINSSFLVLVLLIVYRLLFITAFNRTVGMNLLNLTFLNGDLKRLSIAERLLASFFILYRGTNYYNK